jgi:hypothetical protein
MSIDPALVKINLSLLVLFESIVNRRIFADRTFEFEYNQRQTIDVQNAVGDAFFAANDF